MKLRDIIVLGALAGAFMLSSCSDFLNEDPKGQLNSSSFFTTQEELNMAVYSLYREINLIQCNTNPEITRWSGDDLTTNPGSNKQAYAEADGFHPADGNKGVDAFWSTAYSAIKAANYIILNAEHTPTTKEELNIAIGQAKAWRAVWYFMLVRGFGPVPLNLDGTVDYNRPLAPVADVYAQIEKDLKEAIDILPTSYSEEPRKVDGANIYVTRQAAQSTLVAVLMAEGGWPLNKSAKYAEAAAMAKTVIDGVKAGTYEYMLEPDYYNVYAPSHNNSNECVLGISFGVNFGAWNEDSQMSSSNLYESLGGWGDGWGEIQFWKDFPEGVRKDATYNKKILYNNGRNGETQLCDWWEKCAPGYTEYHPMFRIFTCGVDGNNYTDYDYTKPAFIGMTTGQRHRLIRYSEVLLWYAEAQARSEGTPNALAYECLNKVRKRAGEGDAPAGMSGNDFADLCVKEHGWEVAGNWVGLVTRRDDQMRMNTLEQAFNIRKANTPIEVAPGITMKEQVEIPASVTWQGEKSIYMPYPSLDTQLNSNLKH